jgi:uncharacterized protein YegP (UPF0339 family)
MPANPNPENDFVEVYRDEAGAWRWRRVDGDNGRIVSAATEGYADRLYATRAAAAYNHLPIGRIFEAKDA